jgi:GTP-binding protein LepA
LAVECGLEIIPVINKIDLPAAQADVVAEEIEHTLGFNKNECFRISAKSGIGIDELLNAITMLMPSPKPDNDPHIKALIFDSHFDGYRGVICYVRVFSGTLQPAKRLNDGSSRPI